MSDTPRTDAKAIQWNEGEWKFIVPAQFAESLERDLDAEVKAHDVTRELLRKNSELLMVADMALGLGTNALADLESELVREKKSHDETIKELESCTRELHACADHIKKLETCLERGLDEHASLSANRDLWRSCAEKFAEAVKSYNAGDFGIPNADNALAEFDALKRKEAP